jgi:hypothetical protein
MNPLLQIPGLGGYLASQQMRQQQEAQGLQQAGTVLSLQAALQQQAQEQQLREALTRSGGDVEKALALAIEHGNLAGAAKLAPIVEARRKAGQGQPIGSGGLRLPSGEIVPPERKPAQPPQLIQLMQIRNALPEGSPDRAILDDAIKKLSTHQPPVNVYSGSLVPGIDKHGNPIFAQPSGRPDVPPRIATDIFPRPDAAAERERRAGIEQEATLESVRGRIASMTQKLQQQAGIVGPLGIARRAGETVAGMAAPDMPTPALDYQNEMRLLLTDVRKIVEKDPNLSNEERRNLYETLGGGTFQTPGSAFRTLNNILGYMENKRVTGPGRAARIEQAPQDPAQRVKDKTYQTPRGPMRWTGTGWIPQ